MKSRLAPIGANKLAPRPGAMVHRWLQGYIPQVVSTLAAPNGAAGKVFLTGFEVENDVVVDAISHGNGDSVAGNIIVGIYGPLVTNETCLGAPVAVQSASTALAGTTTPQLISLTPTRLERGRYYVALEYSDTTTRYYRLTTQTILLGSQGQFYDRGGGYGALTDPCPAVTNTATTLTVPRVRCVP